MAWLTPPVFSPGAVASSDLNILSDDLLETAAAKATAASFARHFVGAGANSVAERLIKDDIVDTNQTTTSVAYADLGTVGPQINSIDTGAFMLAFINAKMENTATGESSRASLGVYGVSSIGGTDARGLLVQNSSGHEIRAGCSILLGVTAGSNVPTMEYRVSAGTGEFGNRRLIVMGL